MRRDGAANRERILLAAAEVFGTGGEAASTEEVARQAGVGVATVFRHFPTKQDLLEAAAVRHLEQMESQARAVAGHADAGQALAVLMRSLVSSSAAKFALAALLHTDGRGVTEPVAAASGRFHEAVGLVLARAQSAGNARDDVTVGDVFLLTRALAQVTAPSQDVERALTIILDGFRAPAEAVGALAEGVEDTAARNTVR